MNYRRRRADNRQHQCNNYERMHDFAKLKLVVRRDQIRNDTRGNRTDKRRADRVKQRIDQHIDNVVFYGVNFNLHFEKYVRIVAKMPNFGNPDFIKIIPKSVVVLPFKRV